MRRTGGALLLAAGCTTAAKTLAASCMPALPSFIKPPIATGGPHTCLDAYPFTAVVAGEEGTAELSFFIKRDGTVRAPKIVRSTGFPDLDQAARSCVLNFRYIPASKNGRPVEVAWQVRVAFCLGHCAGSPARGVSAAPKNSSKRPKETKKNCVPIAALPNDAWRSNQNGVLRTG